MSNFNPIVAVVSGNKFNFVAILKLEQASVSIFFQFPMQWYCFYSFIDCKLPFYYEECIMHYLSHFPSQSTTINTGNQLNTGNFIYINQSSRSPTCDIFPFKCNPNLITIIVLARGTGRIYSIHPFHSFFANRAQKKEFYELAYFLFIMYINLNTTITNIITWAENARSLFCLSHCEGRHGGGGVKCDKLGFSVH